MKVNCIHVLGHPTLPLEPSLYSHDAQIWTCWRFCQLLGYMKIPYVYYGLKSSRLPEGGEGRFVQTAKLEAPWRYGNWNHKKYGLSLSAHLRQNVKSANAVIASMYGAPQSDLGYWLNPIIEPMVGYDHCWTRYRVFPSYAQQNVIYNGYVRKTGLNCRAYDAVIPHFLDADEFPLGNGEGDYLLYLGRDQTGKGVDVARQVAKRSKLPFREEHQGWYGKAKAELLGNARAVLMPTAYVEPFGYVAIEAMMCGTPVITTDWGAFTELIQNGVQGYRCRRLDQFLEAVEKVSSLDREEIRRYALAHYSIPAVAPSYQEFFNHLPIVQDE